MSFPCSGNNKNLNAATGVVSQNELSEQQSAKITLPPEILTIIPEGEDVSVAVTLFNKTTLFPVRESLTSQPPASDTLSTERVVGSQVISIQVAGVEEGTLLDTPIELVLSLNQIENQDDINIDNPLCVFWDFALASK